MPANTASGGVRKLRAAQTERALKEAAVRVFARVGYLNTKITDITAEAGRSAGSFYSHFADKERLLEALLHDLMDEGDREVIADPAHSPDFTDRAAVRWHVAQSWHFTTDHAAVMTALRQAALVDDRFARRLWDLMSPLAADLASHFAYVSAAGHTLPGPPQDLARAMMALVSEYHATWLTEPEHTRLSADAAIDLVTDLIFTGITGPRP
ncbi:TetR/AcrR family transcriptional regulator [Actinocorallia sp. A-T 12471]|uniref:TetR/AcrR family transcriptional regulator n=1 Tax=Actinocorallia sp. A-T 12471 TaxID=3089813 RepID=UPI0029CC90DA|nr:TetR/AcrR family transcriptional regulator [Actinocorallia sp. A-T 12471]MDX6740469.1 TetR/AcrR family transcriptional regulator [Actinocorallia sp. A-T 12471]